MYGSSQVILISGQKGFIGSNLWNNTKNKKMGFTKSDGQNMLKYKQVDEAVSKVDFVYHLAAKTNPGESKRNPKKYFWENTEGTLNFLEACRKYDKPLVYTSSCEIYGDNHKITEKSEIKPTNPYAASKVACDRICHAYIKCYGMDIKILRLFNPYGPGQQMNKVIPMFHKQIKSGNPITIYGNGSDTRDFTYIDDVVSALRFVGSIKFRGALNIATGTTTSVSELASKMVRMMNGNPDKILYAPYPKYKHGGIGYQACHPIRAKKLGWSHKTDIEEGLRRTIEWLEAI